MANEPEKYKRFGTTALAIAEDVIYVGIATLLVVGAAALLIDAGHAMVTVGSHGVGPTMLEMLDRLLLVFVVVELLFAVRTTLRRRELVAEPFLVIGIIASIKEIVVLSVEAADAVGNDKVFMHSMIEIGVLGVLVLLLSVAALLMRAKEDKPQEGSGSATSPDADSEDGKADHQRASAQKSPTGAGARVRKADG